MQDDSFFRCLMYQFVSDFLLLFFRAMYHFLADCVCQVRPIYALQEVAKDPFSIPNNWLFSNYIIAFNKMNYMNSLKNTAIITVTGCIGLVIMGTMCGYWLIRHPSKINNFIFYLILGAMAIPFQAIMVPSVRVLRDIGLHGSHFGLSFSYWGMACSSVIFLTYGAIRSIPYEIEEAAIIDGCSKFILFFKIIFPLLRTIILTFTILNMFWFWNDYLMPNILLGNQKRLYTIQIALRVFSGENTTRWDYLLSAIILAMVVPLIVFVSFQKLIINGMVSGAVKG